MIASKKIQFVRWFAAAAAVAALAGCSGGGAPTTENPVTRAPEVSDYTGPASANADVQAFRINLWENIKSTNRCGGCHGAGGQTPMFARNDDVNMAYQAANTVANLAQPEQSRLVTKVSGGHNCWLQSPAACGDTMTVWIRNWAGANATGGTQIKLTAPPIKEVGGSKQYPANATLANFANTTLYRLVTNPGSANCLRCHASNSATQQQPFFADADVDTAYAAIRSKVNLDNPTASRLYVRLHDENHNCWGAQGCLDNAREMLDAINAFAGPIQITPIPPGLLISKGLTLHDGTVAAGGNRYEAATIAKYEFKDNAGNIAYDSSGNEPALNLTLSGDYAWVGGWGINFKGPNAMAKGTSAASKKLSDLIKSTGEFTVEAWVNNANVAQQDAFIVSYSAGATSRNFTLAQRMYQYEMLTRSSKTNGNGAPALLTRAADQDAQAALQHVVMTYSPVDGRRLFVNGEPTGDVDPQGGGGLAEWDDTYAFVLGNETSNNRPWLGVLRLVAIHNRALTPAQVKQNFDAGVGEKYFMLFNVSHLVNVPQAYVMLEAAQLDTYGLQFSKPTFISLDASANVSNLQIEGVRVGVNGLEARSGQAFSKIVSTVGGVNYTAGAGQELSRIGTVIGFETGVDNDLFFLTFERIGTNAHAFAEPAFETPAPLIPALESDVGLRTFDEINETLSQLTGVAPTDTRVRDTFEVVKQSLPSVEKFGTFGPAQQTAIAQLAIKYCSVMVDTQARREAFFGTALNMNATAMANFGGAGSRNVANRNVLINALLTKGINTGLQFTPTDVYVTDQLNVLMDTLVGGPTGTAPGGTATVMKATCSAVLGSGTTLIQ